MSLPSRSTASKSLRPSSRLLDRAAFLRFFEGSRKHSRGAVLYYSRSNDLGYARLGITIKKRCTSVERNRLKRVVREAFRHVRSKLGANDFNIVVTQQVPTDRQKALQYGSDLSRELERQTEKKM